MSVGVVSLFSGVGGFDYGFEQAGYRTVFQCEIDERCRSVLRRHFPDVPQWGDITTLTGEHIVSTLAANGQTPDVIIWGSPCQDLSVAGKGAGLAGARSGLYYEGIRIINEIRKATHNEYPRISVWENVAGALNTNSGADFGQVIDTLAEAGAMVIEWRLLDAQYFGIPQRRRRVFVVAVFDPATAERCTEEVLPVGTSVRRDTATSRSTQQGAAASSESSTRSESEQQHAEQIVLSFDTQFGSNANVFENHSPPLKASQSPPSVIQPTQLPLQTPERKAADDSEMSRPIVFDNSYRNNVRVISGDVSPALTAKMETGGNNTPMVAFVHNNVESPPSMTEPQAVLIREREGKAGGGKGLLLSPESSLSLLAANEQKLWIDDEQPVLRRLMPVECERLMGWADDWTRYGHTGEELADTHRYKMCGNGVASPVARWIAEQIGRVL